MDWKDVAELCERNTYYDANQYKLEDWQDQNFSDYLVDERDDGTAKDWEDIPHGEGGAGGEERELVLSYVDGSDRLYSENILGEGLLKPDLGEWKMAR